MSTLSVAGALFSFILLHVLLSLFMYSKWSFFLHIFQLQDTETTSGESEVKFQVSRDTLGAMLRSMAYIREQLSNAVSVVFLSLEMTICFQYICSAWLHTLRRVLQCLPLCFLLLFILRGVLVRF